MVFFVIKGLLLQFIMLVFIYAVELVGDLLSGSGCGGVSSYTVNSCVFELYGSIQFPFGKIIFPAEVLRLKRDVEWGVCCNVIESAVGAGETL